MNVHLPEAIPHIPEADSFDFKKSLEMVKQAIYYHKLLILLTIVLTLILVIIYMRAFPSNYEAEVVMIADSPKDMQREDFYKHWNIFRTPSLADEGEIMTSNLIIGKVVDELDLKYADVYHSLLNHVGYLWVESWIGKKYRAIKSWLFPKDSKYALSPEEFERAKTVTSFKDGVALKSVKDTNMGTLIVRGPSPRVADVANTMVDLYLVHRKERMMQEAKTAYDALKAEVDKASTKLIAIESDLERHFHEHGMLFEYEKDKLQITTWLELRASIVEIEAKIADIEAALIEIDHQLEKGKTEVLASRVITKNTARTTLHNQITQLQISLEQTKLRYSDDSPEVKEIVNQIKALDKLMSKENKNEESQSTKLLSETYTTLKNRRSVLAFELEGLRANLDVKRASEKKIGEQLASLPEITNKTQKLKRERQLWEKRYVGLSDKLTMAAVSRATIASAPPSIRVVDYAEYPEKPYWPKPKYLVLGAIVFGAVMGLIIAILLDFINGRISRYHFNASNSREEFYAIVSRDKEYFAKMFKLARTNSNA